MAVSGDVILLAPGGTSYDAYEDFAARGNHFRSLVRDRQKGTLTFWRLEGFDMATMKIKRKSVDQIRPKLTLHFDYWLLLAIAALIVIGLLTVYSTTFDIGLRWKGEF